MCRLISFDWPAYSLPDVGVAVSHCGIAEIRFYAESWVDVVKGGGEMVLFDYPKRIDD